MNYQNITQPTHFAMQYIWHTLIPTPFGSEVPSSRNCNNQGVQANLSKLPEDGTSVPKHVAVYVWHVLHDEVHLLEHSMLTTTRWPQHVDHNMLTTTCWPQHADHNMLTTRTRTVWIAQNVANLIGRAHKYRRGEERHTGPYFQNLASSPRTAIQLLTLCSLHCSPRAERWLRNWEVRIPTVEMHHSVQTEFITTWVSNL